MTESIKDLLLAIGLAALGMAMLLVLHNTHNNGAHVADVLDFATLPRIYALMLTGLSLLLAGSALFNARKKEGTEAASSRARSPHLNPVVLGRAVGTVALTVLYVLGIESLPFFPVTAMFLAVTFILYGRRPFWGVAVVALLGSAALDVVFVRIINLPLH